MLLWVVNIALHQRFATNALPPSGFGWDAHLNMPPLVLAGARCTCPFWGAKLSMKSATISSAEMIDPAKVDAMGKTTLLALTVLSREGDY